MHGMLRTYNSASLDNLNTKIVKGELLSFAKRMNKMVLSGYNKLPNFYIYGKYRKGKTYVAHAIINKFINKFNETSIWYIDSPRLYDYFRTNEIWRFDYTWIDKLKDTKVLVLDDLGQEYRSGSGFVESNIETFLRWRFAHGRKTFILTNGSPSKLSQLYGESFTQFILDEYVAIDIEEKEER